MREPHLGTKEYTFSCMYTDVTATVQKYGYGKYGVDVYKRQALMHGIWTCLMIGGLIHIGSAADSAVWYNYVLDTDSFLLTGGDFGVESSVISIACLLYTSKLALIWL